MMKVKTIMKTELHSAVRGGLRQHPNIMFTIFNVATCYYTYHEYCYGNRITPQSEDVEELCERLSFVE
jgi:hypothetical protein